MTQRKQYFFKQSKFFHQVKSQGPSEDCQQDRWIQNEHTSGVGGRLLTMYKRSSITSLSQLNPIQIFLIQKDKSKLIRAYCQEISQNDKMRLMSRLHLIERRYLACKYLPKLAVGSDPIPIILLSPSTWKLSARYNM